MTFEEYKKKKKEAYAASTRKVSTADSFKDYVAQRKAEYRKNAPPKPISDNLAEARRRVAVEAEQRIKNQQKHERAQQNAKQHGLDFETIAGHHLSNKTLNQNIAVRSAERKYADSLLPDLIKQKAENDKELSVTNLSRATMDLRNQDDENAARQKSAELQDQINELLYLKYGGTSALESRIYHLKQLKKETEDANLRVQYNAELNAIEAGKDSVEQKSVNARQTAAAEWYAKIPKSKDFKAKSSENVDAANLDLQSYLNRNERDTSTPGKIDQRVAKYEGKSAYGDITEEEAAIYRYLWNTGGKDVANEFLEKTELIRSEREAKATAAEFESFTKEHPVIANTASFAGTLLKGRGYVDNFYRKLGGKPINPYSVDNRIGMNVDAIRSTTGEMLNDKLDSSIPSFLYNTGMSMADSVVSVGLLGPGGSVVLGMGAAADTSRDIKMRGGSDDQALLGGFAAGAAEMVFERVSIDKLLSFKNPQTLKEFLTEVLKQAGVEASEETFTEIANIISDGLIMGDLSNYNLLVEQYMTDDLSREEAEAKAKGDMAKNIALAGLGGFLSGGGMGAGSAAIGHVVNTSARGQQEIKNKNADKLIQNGLIADEGSAVYRQAQRLAERQEAEKRISNYSIGRLANTMDRYEGGQLNPSTFSTRNAGAKMTGSDTSVRVMGLNEVGENGNITLNTADGGVVNLSDVTFSNPVVGQLYSNASKYGTMTARSYVSGYEKAVQHNPSLSVESYDTAFNGIRTMAEAGVSSEDARQRVGEFYKQIGEFAGELAYYTGTRDKAEAPKTAAQAPQTATEANSSPDVSVVPAASAVNVGEESDVDDATIDQAVSKAYNAGWTLAQKHNPWIDEDTYGKVFDAVVTLAEQGYSEDRVKALYPNYEYSIGNQAFSAACAVGMAMRSRSKAVQKSDVQSRKSFTTDDGYDTINTDVNEGVERNVGEEARLIRENQTRDSSVLRQTVGSGTERRRGSTSAVSQRLGGVQQATNAEASQRTLGKGTVRKRVNNATISYTETSESEYSNQAAAIKKEYDRLGIESAIIGGYAVQTKNGKTTRILGESSTLGDGTVLVRNNTDGVMSAKMIAGHEMYHVAEKRGYAEGEAFAQEIIDGGINLQSKEFVEITDEIHNVYGEKFSIFNNYKKFYEEFCGFVSGNLYENDGHLSEDFSAMFNDPQAVEAAWVEMRARFMPNGTSVAESNTLEGRSKKYGAQAQAYIHTYQAGQDVDKFDAAYKIAYDLGKSGGIKDYAMNSLATGYLTETQREIAYETGRAAREATDDASAENSENFNAAYQAAKEHNSDITENGFVTAYKTVADLGKSGLSFARVSEKVSRIKSWMGETAFKAAYDTGVAQRNPSKPAKELRGNAGQYNDSGRNTKEKRLAKRITGKIGKRTGIRFDVVDSIKNANGATEYGNIQYDEKGNPIITISMESPNIVSTAFHELTHWLRDKAPTEYQRYADYALNWMAKTSKETTEALIAEYQERFNTDREGAIEEIVCDASEAMLNDRNAVFDFAKENRGVAKEIADFFRDLFDAIDDYLSTHSFNYAIGGQLSKEAELVRDLRDLWVQAFNAAVENSQNGATENAAQTDGGTRSSRELGGYFPDIDVSTKSINVFNIKNINDISEVKQKVYEYLKSAFISTDVQSKPIVNLDTKMAIEIRKGGINETFGNARGYKNLTSKKKKIKLATMTSLAKLIKYGEVRSPESNNYHNPNSTSTFAYLTAPIKIDGVLYNVNMDIKKTPDGNRFYIHNIKIADGAPSPNQSSVKLNTPSADSTISHSKSGVNTNISENAENDAGRNSVADTEFAPVRHSFAPEKNQSEIDRAEELERKNWNRDEIWQETGLIRDPRGVWLHEIDDSGFRIKTEKGGHLPVRKYLAPLDRFVQHDKLYEEYPQIRDVRMVTRPVGSYGSYHPRDELVGDRRIYFSDSIQNTKDKPFVDITAMHEIQHAMQDEDGRLVFSDENAWAAWDRRNGYAILNRYERQLRARKDQILDSLSKEEREAYMRIDELYQELISVGPTQGVPDGEARRRKMRSISEQREAIIQSLENEPWYQELLEIEAAFEDRNLLARKAYGDAYFNTVTEIEARETADRLRMTPEERRANTPDLGWDRAFFLKEENGEERLSVLDEERTPATRSAAQTDKQYAQVFSVSKYAPETDGGVRNSIDSEGASVKEQLQENLSKLNALDVVAVKEVDKLFTKKNEETKKWILETLASTGYKVKRDDVGEIIFDKKRIGKGLRYAKTSEELAAFAVLPEVMEKGIIIGGHLNHKSRNYDTITIAGPVLLNGTKGNMAVVIRQEDKNYYKVHRLLMPDGSQFVFTEQKRNRTERAGGTNERSGLSPTDTISINSIPNPDEIVKQNSDEVSDNSFSIPTQGQAKLLDMYEKGEITREEYLARISESQKPELQTPKDSRAVQTPAKKMLWESDEIRALLEKYGALPKGENAVVDIDVPQNTADDRNVRRFTRTVLESGVVTEDMLDVIEDAILDGALSYTPISDEKAIQYAERTVKNQGMRYAKMKWNEIVHSAALPKKGDIAIGEYLLRAAAESGDKAALLQYTAEVAQIGTRAGQAVQAMSLLKKMGGAGELVAIKKAVEKENEEIERKYKGKKPPVKLNEELAEQLVNAKTKAERDAIRQQILKDVAEQVPSSFLDKWNAWRYLAMLGNLRTHIRNIVGNAIFAPAMWTKNRVAYVLESAFAKDSKTKVLTVPKGVKEFAKQDWAEMQDIITSGGKLNPSDIIRDNQRVFKTKVLEMARRLNFDLLEKEDGFFLERYYRSALGAYLASNKVDVQSIDTATLQKAREYAVNEAQKATYRDASAVATALSNLSRKNKALNLLVEGVPPFKKTPINILKRGVEYSPAGLLFALGKGTHSLVKGNITINEYIDGISAGFTGTAVFAVGMLLGHLGIAVGGLGDDKEDKFKKLQGMQSYSIQIGGKSYTVDFAAPASIPFFMGVELSGMFAEDGEITVSDVMDAIQNSAQPMIEMSMLSGLSSAIETVGNSKNVLGDLAMNTLTGYASQAVPTALGQVARTVDPVSRRTYADKNIPFVNSGIQIAAGKVVNKIPGLSTFSQPALDEWGREYDTGNVLQRGAQNFLSPGYAGTINTTRVDEALDELYEETGESAVLPSKSQKYVTVDGEKVHFTAEEYTNFAKLKGQASYNLIERMISKSAYKTMSSEQKIKAIKKVYDYAQKIAKESVVNYEIGENEWPNKARKSGDVAGYILDMVEESSE